MSRKIVRVTIDLVVDDNVDSKFLVQEMDYDFTPMNDEVIHETEIIDYEEVNF